MDHLSEGRGDSMYVDHHKKPRGKLPMVLLTVHYYYMYHKHHKVLTRKYIQHKYMGLPLDIVCTTLHILPT